MTYQAVIEQARQQASWQEDLYREVHRHPEVSMQEHQTCRLIAQRLRELGGEATELGGGVVGILRNGDGPTVLARADIDALPVQEASGLDYASEVSGVMHACGHDMHLAALLGAVGALAAAPDDWHGTFVAVFQPGEETAAGAQAMLDAGLLDVVPRPDVCLGQHVLAFPAGEVRSHVGPVLSEATSVAITVYGSGSHGSMPHLSVDPVVLASALVLRLQTIVSRVVGPGEFAVVTVGSLQAGSTANVIPESARLLVNVRTYSDDVMALILRQIEQIVRAECQASGCPREPEITYYDVYPLTSNDAEAGARVQAAFDAYFGDRHGELGRLTASEDFSRIPSAWGVPSCYWGFGGFPAEGPMVPNHNPAFAPVLQPTLTTGTEALLVAAGAWFGA